MSSKANTHRILLSGHREVLYSYESPVAIRIVNALYRSERYVRFSASTSRHISQWADGAPILVVPHAEFVKMIAPLQARGLSKGDRG